MIARDTAALARSTLGLSLAHVGAGVKVETVTRQRLTKAQRVERRRKRRVAAGRCYRCNAVREQYAILCDKHQALQRERIRRLEGSKAWREGGPGRRPLNRRPSALG